jgi:hypothetical protein
MSRPVRVCEAAFTFLRMDAPRLGAVLPKKTQLPRAALVCAFECVRVCLSALCVCVCAWRAHACQSIGDEIL